MIVRALHLEYDTDTTARMIEVPAPDAARLATGGVGGVAGVGDWLLVCAETVLQVRSTIHPALNHVVEMALSSLKIVVRK